MNHQLKSALNIYRSGLAFFSKDETFVQSYVQFLLDHQQIEECSSSPREQHSVNWNGALHNSMGDVTESSESI